MRFFIYLSPVIKEGGGGVKPPPSIYLSVVAIFTAHIALAALHAACENRSASSDFSALDALSINASTSLLLSVIGF